MHTRKHNTNYQGTEEVPEVEASAQQGRLELLDVAEVGWQETVTGAMDLAAVRLYICVPVDTDAISARRSERRWTEWITVRRTAAPCAAL